MNRLGKMIQKYVRKNDSVLDLGCGVMQATSDTLSKGKLKCKSILGVDLQMKYLDKIKDQYQTILMGVTEAYCFPKDSYDVVICTDVLEHLTLVDAHTLLSQMKRIVRKFVIIFTPAEYDPNGDNVENSWGMGLNELQKHQCLIPITMLEKLDYKTSIISIDDNILGVYSK